MRYYRQKQADMVKHVAYFLKTKQEVLIERVPASKGVTETYLRMAEGIYKGQFTKLQTEVKSSPAAKGLTRADLEKVIMKLASAALMSGAVAKGKKEAAYPLTVRGLKKLTAAALCNEYIAAMATVKKIRNPSFYGLSKDFFTDAQASYKAFSAMKNLPSMKKKENAEWNSNLDEAIGDALDYLRQTVDPMMRIASADDAEMARSYKSVRIVHKGFLGRPSDKELAFRKSRKRRKENTEKQTDS